MECSYDGGYIMKRNIMIGFWVISLITLSHSIFGADFDAARAKKNLLKMQAEMDARLEKPLETSFITDSLSSAWNGLKSWWTKPVELSPQLRKTIQEESDIRSNLTKSLKRASGFMQPEDEMAIKFSIAIKKQKAAQAKYLIDQQAEAQRIADEKAAEESRIALAQFQIEEEAYRLLVAQQLATVAAKEVTKDLENKSIADEQVTKAAEAKRVADELAKVQRLVEEQAAKELEAKSLADEQVEAKRIEDKHRVDEQVVAEKVATEVLSLRKKQEANVEISNLQQAQEFCTKMQQVLLNAQNPEQAAIALALFEQSLILVEIYTAPTMVKKIENESVTIQKLQKDEHIIKPVVAKSFVEKEDVKPIVDKQNIANFKPVIVDQNDQRKQTTSVQTEQMSQVEELVIKLPPVDPTPESTEEEAKSISIIKNLQDFIEKNETAVGGALLCFGILYAAYAYGLFEDIPTFETLKKNLSFKNFFGNASSVVAEQEQAAPPVKKGQKS